MGICVTFRMNQFVSEDISNNHFFYQSRLEQIGDADRSCQSGGFQNQCYYLAIDALRHQKSVPIMPFSIF